MFGEKGVSVLQLWYILNYFFFITKFKERPELTLNGLCSQTLINRSSFIHKFMNTQDVLQQFYGKNLKQIDAKTC